MQTAAMGEAVWLGVGSGDGGEGVQAYHKVYPGNGRMQTGQTADLK